MNPFAVLLLLILVIVGFTYGVARTLLHVWLEHRVKLSLLKKYEENPALFSSSSEVWELVAEQDRAASQAARQDYRITGVILCLLGAACVGTAFKIGLGTMAVGLYTGGVLCLLLGVLIGLLGVLIRALVRTSRPTSAESGTF